MNRKNFSILISSLILLLTVACNTRTIVTPTAPPILSSPTALAVARPTPSPARAPQPTPAWWDKQIGLPKGAEFIGDTKNTVWSTRDTNAENIKDFLVKQANAAGYQTFTLTQSQGAIYDVLLVKGQTAYALNITLGSDVTIITANRTGVMNLKTAGVANIDITLPMRTRVDVTPGSEISIGTAVPSDQCVGCEYFINVHIAPFKGVGNYDSKPGTYIIDVELVPGGDRDRDNYRWAQSCVVTVNQNSGSFDCQGLQNMNDLNQKLDASGSWTQ